MATHNSVGYAEKTGTDRTPRFAFIDAANVYASLTKVLKAAGFAEGEYDCIVFNDLFKDYERRYVYYAQLEDAALPGWVEDLQKNDGYILRVDRTTKKGKVTKQEGVDVRLAIEAIQHSYNRTMASCGLFSGDGDFLPLIDALTNNGTFVSVHGFSDPDKGTVTPELRNRADRYVRMTKSMVRDCLADQFKPEWWISNSSPPGPTGTVSLDNEDLRVWANGDTAESLAVWLEYGKVGPKKCLRFKSELALKYWFRLSEESEQAMYLMAQ